MTKIVAEAARKEMCVCVAVRGYAIRSRLEPQNFCVIDGWHELVLDLNAANKNEQQLAGFEA